MAMDSGTIAAVAALVVSVIAMIVACAQAIQQYVITGQLIRICDGVVYGKMPGQGRRVWEYSQFRFRVVYSMPQVGLRPSLWFDMLPQQQSYYSKGHLPLPDLRHRAHRRVDNSFSYALGYLPRPRMRSEYSATPGEASWVSFCRVAQHASESDLFYDLIDCDADRCPSDLPAVPMQVSLRDAAVIAIMAGMRCTYASFEKKSLSMSGSGGTITSSWHPLLGATIHFAPRNYNALSDNDARMDEILGLRIGRGSISSAWMARMSDIIIIAGRQYDSHDRRSYEEFEGHTWITLSRSRAMVKASMYSPLRQAHSPVRTYRLRSISPGRDFRPRGRSRASTRSRSRQSVTSRADGPIILPPEPAAGAAGEAFEVGIRPSKNDGNWTFESEVSASTSVSGDIPQHKNVPQHLYQSEGTATPPIDSRYKRAVAFLRTRFSSVHAVMLRREPAADLENDGMTGIPAMTTAHTQSAGNRQADKHGRRRSRSIPAKNQPQHAGVGHAGGHLRPRRAVRTGLDGQGLQDYITEKRARPVGVDSTVHGQLLLPWRPEAEESSGLPDQQGEPEDWIQSVHQLHLDQTLFAIHKWRMMLDKRRQLREESSTQDDWEVESLQTYRSASVPSSRATTPPSRRDSRSGSRESRGSTHRSGTLSPRGDLEPEARGRVRTPKMVGELRYQSPSPLSLHRSTGRGSVSDEARRVAYGDEPIDPVGDMTRTGPSEEEPEIKCDPSIQLRENQTDRNHDDETTNSTPSHSSSKKQQVKKPRRVQILLPGHPDDPESEIASIATTSNASERNSSVERARPRVGSLKRSDTRGGDLPRVAGGVDESRLGDQGAENIRPAPVPVKPILKAPKQHFPEDEYPVREGVATLRDLTKDGIPAGARWTKIKRALVNPEALERCRERFEERDDSVIVLRVLSKKEIIKLAQLTQEIREAREQQWHPDRLTESPASMSDSEDEFHRYQTADAPSHAAPRQGRRTASSSRGSSPSPHSRLTSPAVSIPPTPTSDRNSFISQPGPRRRRASTRSDISVRESLESDSDDLQRPRSRSTGRRSIFDDELAPTSRPSTGFDTNPQPEEKPSPGLVDWFWLSQADVLPGYCATPWQRHFSESTCFGAIMTMLVALEYYYADVSTLRYVEKQAHCEQWIRQGRSTYPSYAINAMGGVVVSRKYPRVKFDCLSTPIPPIELLDSYRYQVTRSGFEGSSRSVMERLGELMCLDSWLSLCGRLPEIYDGSNDMLRSTPALVQKIMTDFDFVFSRLNRTPAEGGLQIIQEVAESIVHTLEQESLSEVEQLFAVVAILRTAKMALCVIYGPGTAQLRDILVNDVQVYLV
ncbi:hypothetical protein AYL99_11362 [Fonsecaea erecta]|uniref:DUF8035 domain-containing protein n=1 Tax=Fonsecaea erecta TaxID=1367422 RepID=A0A178Z3Z2_9EURO|nr:hypothetical protein AYL99_11362 [Fonsecaea erecta]OAP54261.1 hypothetical protein AYL99_11362 [Fonsecaea erecta]